MIELNCSYEESKKILELGFDFSPTCRDFQDIQGLTRIKVNNDCFISLFADRGDFDEAYPVWDLSIDNILKEGYTPIIPKAALEACLPDKLDVASSDSCVFVKNIDLKTISLSYFFEDYYSCYAEQKEFNSAFEAFTWCHEYYPEELKKKFNEVMK